MVILTLVGWVGYLWFEQSPSVIMDFQPSTFDAKADAPFFYSMGKELKSGDDLDPDAPTVLRGEIENFLVSPDATEIAVVTNGLLMIVGRDGTLRHVAPVDSIYREPKPIGQQFYRDDNFQWTRDSKSLFLIRDEYYHSNGSQLYSEKGELWRYDVQTGNMKEVLSPFPAYNYFLGRGSGIYFSVPTKSGDLELKYFDGRSTKDTEVSEAHQILAGGLSGGPVESSFFSFSLSDYQDVVLPAKGVALVENQGDRQQKLVIRGRPYLTLTEGEGLKGPFYCSAMLRSVFLPGDRYFLFNTNYCGNYEGQLLIDAATGQYERLPTDTRVYLTFDTDSDPTYRITGEGMLAK